MNQMDFNKHNLAIIMTHVENTQATCTSLLINEKEKSTSQWQLLRPNRPVV